MTLRHYLLLGGRGESLEERYHLLFSTEGKRGKLGEKIGKGERRFCNVGLCGQGEIFSAPR